MKGVPPLFRVWGSVKLCGLGMGGHFHEVFLFPTLSLLASCFPAFGVTAISRPSCSSHRSSRTEDYLPSSCFQKGFKDFIPLLFHKRKGSCCPILDLKALNVFIQYQKFNMDSTRPVIVSLYWGPFLASLVIKAAYLNVPVSSTSAIAIASDCLSHPLALLCSQVLLCYAPRSSPLWDIWTSTF